jgi:hypothetical protein
MTEAATQPQPRKHKKARMMLAPRSPKLQVTVDAATITESIRRNSSHCMIAEAVKRTVPYATSVMVDLQSIRFTDKDRGLRYSYLTPRHAQLAIIAFDQGNRPKPFKMELAGGAVRRARHYPRRGEAVPALAERQEIISRVQAKRSHDRISLQDVGDATDIATRTLEKLVSATPPVFGRDAADRLIAWTEGRPIPKRPNAVPQSLVSGRPRLRGGVFGPRSAPQVVGGGEPPIGNIAKRRGFGLRSMVV